MGAASSLSTAWRAHLDGQCQRLLSPSPVPFPFRRCQKPCHHLHQESAVCGQCSDRDGVPQVLGLGFGLRVLGCELAVGSRGSGNLCAPSQPCQFPMKLQLRSTDRSAQRGCHHYWFLCPPIPTNGSRDLRPPWLHSGPRPGPTAMAVRGHWLRGAEKSCQSHG